MHRLYTCIISMLLVLSVAAGGPYRFQSLTMTEGLSSGSVKCMFIDTDGFLWIGTDAGLDRYDGYEVENMGSKIGEKWQYGNIDELQEDALGYVWIDCEHTYLIYDTHHHTFTDDAASLLKQWGIDVSGKDYSVKVDDTGSVWVLQSGRIMRYDCRRGTCEKWTNLKLNINDVRHIASTATKDGVLISMEHEVMRFVRATGRLEKLSLPAEMLFKENIYGTFVDADHSVWIYSYITESVCRYSMGGKVVKEMVSLPAGDASVSKSNAIRAMMDDGRGNIWISTDHRGVFIYHKQSGEITNILGLQNEKNSLSSNNVTALVHDRQGTVWMGHFKTGVSYTSANYRMFENRGLKYGDISDLHYDSKGNLWVGTDGEGLYIERADGSSVKTDLPNITISSFAEDTDGTMWVGTYNEGLYHFFTPTQYEHLFMGNGKLPTNKAWRIFDDGRGGLWCGSPIYPLICLDKKTGKWRTVKDDEGHSIHCTDFCKDKRGNLLMSSTYGLVEYNLKTGKCHRYTTNRRGNQQFLSHMAMIEHYDSKHDILLLGEKNGLTLYDLKRDSLYFIGYKNSDRNLAAKSIEEDGKGNFWISTSTGISVLSIWLDKHGVLDWQLTNYTAREGLQNSIFNANSSTMIEGSKVLFGGIDGYTVVNTDERSLKAANKEVPVIIGVMAGDRRIDATDGRIELHSNDTFISIRYFTGNLNNTNSIRYAYKLVGKMKDWTYTQENRISLVGLSPGDYELLLRVGESEDDNSTTCVLRIHVNPPFYLSAWAYLVYLLLACFVAYLLWNRSRRNQKMKLLKQKEDMERQKLVQITEMKLKFFTNISHDLRTPLTLIISPVEMMVKKLEGGQTPANILPQLKNVQKNAQLLLNQVSSLLDFRRLDVGVEALQLSCSDIVAQLGSICLSFDDYAKERGIALTCDCDADSFMMQYDKEKMNKIVYNLLSNAFKFTPEGGSVKVSFSHAGQNVIIKVADTGKGILDEDKQNIFHRFYQSHTNESSQTGSGIGLHIVNEYVTMHGGTINVADNTPQGSIFTITLPVVDAEESKTAVPTHEDRSDDANTNAALPSVLVVDDNHDIVEFISSNLMSHYDVLTASNGQEALAVLSSKDVSIIISDVMMPGIDGYELCRRVKSEIKTSHIPVILLTARTTDESKLQGLELGADDYVTKPFNMDVLLLRVQKLMEWSQKSHQQFRQKVDVSPSEITITPLDEQFVKSALKIVEDNIANSDFTVEMLAQQIYMSRSALYKKIMAVTGLGPAEFIRTVRIKRGKALLERSQMQITEIAYSVGFNSLKSFTMNFKAEYGLTPSEYLKKKGFK